MSMRNNVEPATSFSREGAQEVEEEENNKWERIAVVKAASSTQSTLTAIRITLGKALNIPQNEYEVSNVNAGKLFIKFKELDLERAEHKQPIIIYNSLLVFKEWDGSGEAYNIELEEYCV